MLRNIMLDDNGDLIIDSRRNLAMVEGNDEKQQSLKHLLLTNMGEWFLNTLHGLDHSEMQVKNFDEVDIRAAFLEAFEQESRIEEVVSLEIDFDQKARTLKVNFEVRMDGQVIEGEEVF